MFSYQIIEIPSEYTDPGQCRIQVFERDTSTGALNYVMDWTDLEKYAAQKGLTIPTRPNKSMMINLSRRLPTPQKCGAARVE